MLGFFYILTSQFKIKQNQDIEHAQFIPEDK